MSGPWICTPWSLADTTVVCYLELMKKDLTGLAPQGRMPWVPLGRFTVLAVMACGILHSWIIADNLQMVGENGDPWRYFGVSVFAMLGLLVFVFGGVPAGVFFCVTRKYRPLGVRLLILAVVYPGTLFFFGHVGNSIRMAAFRELGARCMPLVHAIESYERERGSLPESLEDLVPAYLDAIPDTGMGAYPAFDYLVMEDAAMWLDNAWVLRLHTTIGGINFDQFMYFPNQQYPAQIGGNRLERLGEWAYLHE